MFHPLDWTVLTNCLLKILRGKTEPKAKSLKIGVTIKDGNRQRYIQSPLPRKQILLECTHNESNNIILSSYNLFIDQFQPSILIYYPMISADKIIIFQNQPVSLRLNY